MIMGSIISANGSNSLFVDTMRSLYHRPKGWDYTTAGSNIPYGKATMWGDYHARELALYLKRLGQQGSYYTFWN